MTFAPPAFLDAEAIAKHMSSCAEGAQSPVVLQQSLTEYPDPTIAPHLLWGGTSLLLLYRVYRGGRAARGIFLALALFGLVVFGLQFGSGVRELLLAGAYGV